MVRTVHFYRGLPGSGKTTHAMKQMASDLDKGISCFRVNKDDIRRTFSAKMPGFNEALVVGTERYLVLDAMAEGVTNIYIDNTHFNPVHEKFYARAATEHAYEFKVLDFTHIPLDVCKERDSKRVLGRVGDQVIQDMHDAHLTKKAVSAPAIVTNPLLPSAIICDLDGTLALIKDRSPYDVTKYDRDVLNVPVAEIVTSMLWRYQRLDLIFVSGRKEAGRRATLAWLHEHFFAPYGGDYRALYMRKDDDNRKDSIVKEEIYNEYIKGKYNVKCVFDDRNQVVDMWRKLGLTCLQVAPGDF